MNLIASRDSDSTLVTNQAWRDCVSPAVSVVVSLYNYSAYIRDCLGSVRASRTDDLPGGFEVVVVDDASVDASVEVVEEFMAAHALPIRLVKKPVNTGLADARNTGLHAARAPFVFILDADNEMRPDCLRAHYETLTSSSHAMVYGRINRFDHATRESLGVMSRGDWNVRDLVSRPCVDAMAMFRIDVLLQLGGYSTEYGTVLPQGWEDYDLCLKLAQAGHSAKLIPRILSDYRVHPKSMVNGTNLFRRELARYFTRKFHVLVQQYPDTTELFDVARREIQIAGWPLNCARPPKSRSQQWAQKILGAKLCRSICKRLADAYVWMSP